MNFFNFCFLDSASASFGVKCLFIHYYRLILWLLSNPFLENKTAPGLDFTSQKEERAATLTICGARQCNAIPRLGNFEQAEERQTNGNEHCLPLALHLST